MGFAIGFFLLDFVKYAILLAGLRGYNLKARIVELRRRDSMHVSEKYGSDSTRRSLLLPRP